MSGDVSTVVFDFFTTASQIAFDNIFVRATPLWTCLPRSWGQNPQQRVFCALLDTGLCFGTSWALDSLSRAQILGCIAVSLTVHESLKSLAPRVTFPVQWGDSLFTAVRIISSVTLACLTLRIPLQAHALFAFAALTPSLLEHFHFLEELYDLVFQDAESKKVPPLSSGSMATDADYALVGIMPAMDYIEAARVYRQATLKCHPDVTNCPRTEFQDLQNAWTRIQKSRKWGRFQLEE